MSYSASGARFPVMFRTGQGALHSMRHALAPSLLTRQPSEVPGCARRDARGSER